MNTGFTSAQMENFIAVLSAKVAPEVGRSAQKVLTEVRKTRK
ncbi:MAG: hypothetical protein ACK5PS_01660 [Desulfopila sp.]